MNRRQIEIDGGHVLAYGHYGRPVVAFPSENGQINDWEDRGMVESLAGLLDAGKLKLYCVPSFDSESWTRDDLSLEERARRHGHYEWWIFTRFVPFVQADSHSARVDRDRHVLRRLPRGELLLEACRPLSGRHLHERRLRRDGAGRRRTR